MASNPISCDPVRIPADLLPFLRFAAPLGADPTGYVGAGSPATALSAAPKRYSFGSSNSPLGNEAFTIAAVVTVSAAMNVGNHAIFATTGGNSGTGGIALIVADGFVRWRDLDAAAGGIVTGVPFDTSPGQSWTMMNVHSPLLQENYGKFYINGTLQISQGNCGSWTSQNTMSVGFDSLGNTWSGGLRDVYVFAKALTPEEIWLLHREMKS